MLRRLRFKILELGENSSKSNKEVCNINEKQFMSTDTAINVKNADLNKPHILRKSGSVDGTQSPMLVGVFLRDQNGKNILKENKIKIKSSKDLTMTYHPKIKNSKSKGVKRNKKTIEKVPLDPIDNKENIRKYMKKKRKKILKDEIREKLFDFKKQTKICNNLKALHKFTRLQTKRTGAFKARSASAQHKLFTGRKATQNFILDTESTSFLQNPKESMLVSGRNDQSFMFNDLKNKSKRTKQSRMKSSSSAMSTKLSTEFYLEYLKILKSMKDPQKYNNTLVYENSSPKRKRSNKRRRHRGMRPKSAPGLRKICKINKGRRGTVDAERLISYKNNKSFVDMRKSYSPSRTKKRLKTKKK